MGKPKGREMLFWTKAEYLKFAEAMMDKSLSYYAFEMLYWCGVREEMCIRDRKRRSSSFPATPYAARAVTPKPLTLQ